MGIQVLPNPSFPSDLTEAVGGDEPATPPVLIDSEPHPQAQRRGTAADSPDPDLDQNRIRSDEGGKRGPEAKPSLPP